MMEEIRQEIQKIEESAEKLKTLAAGNPSLTRNAEIIQTFVYILRFSTPDPDAKG